MDPRHPDSDRFVRARIQELETELESLRAQIDALKFQVMEIADEVARNEGYQRLVKALRP